MTKEQKDLRVFGYGLALISLFFGAGGFIKHGAQWAPVVLLICSVIFGAVTAWDYTALRPGYRGWMAVAHKIGFVVTTVILSTVFFCLFTPVALVLRLLRKDHLDRALRPQAGTYWIARTRVASKDQYQQQY